MKKKQRRLGHSVDELITYLENKMAEGEEIPDNQYELYCEYQKHGKELFTMDKKYVILIVELDKEASIIWE